jgi:hypothetical protein
MLPELIEDAPGDCRNARFLARASDLAYLPGDAGIPAFKEQLGLDATLYTAGTTQVYVATNDRHVVVAFRGTEAPNTLEGLKDWLLTDAMNLLMVPEGRLGTDFLAAGVGAKFHQGFINALAGIWDSLAATVEAELKAKDRPLWLTGHSLGGALALLSAWLFTRKFISVHAVITFGAPMVGNTRAMQAFDKELAGKVFRYVNGSDPVPQLPTVSLLANDFGHCQTEVVGGAAAAAGLFQELARRAVDGLLTATLIDDLWRAINDRVSAHFIPSYHALVEELEKKGS